MAAEDDGAGVGGLVRLFVGFEVAAGASADGAVATTVGDGIAIGGSTPAGFESSGLDVGAGGSGGGATGPGPAAVALEGPESRS